MRLQLRISPYISRDERDKEPHRKLIGVNQQCHGAGIFAIHSGFVGSGRGYKKDGNRVVGKDGGLTSSLPVQGSCLPYGDYRVYRH